MYILIFSFRFEEALQKALRMVDESCIGFDPEYMEVNDKVNKILIHVHVHV